MAIQLTPEQEKRIQAIIDTGVYGSTAETIDAALAAVEITAADHFEGTQDELDALLAEGLSSGEPVTADAAFWHRLTEKTDRMVTQHISQNPGNIAEP